MIEETSECKFYDNIGSFWYHSNDTKKNPWAMLCPHCPINDPSRYWHNTVYLHLCYKPLGILQRVTKSRKVHVSSHEGLKNFIRPILLDADPKVSQRGIRVKGVSLPQPNCLNKEYYITIDQENSQQWPKKTNFKQLKKIRQSQFECHNHSPVFTTIFLTQTKNLSQ